MDQAIKTALQKARRNSNLLVKVAAGIYRVKNRAQVVTVERKAAELTVLYTDERNRVREAALSTFVATL